MKDAGRITGRSIGDCTSGLRTGRAFQVLRGPFADEVTVATVVTVSCTSRSVPCRGLQSVRLGMARPNSSSASVARECVVCVCRSSNRFGVHSGLD
jgi:hypothetical protein